MPAARAPLSRRSRWWRLSLGLVVGLLAVLSMVTVGLVVLGRHLDSPAVKRRVQAAVHSALGLEVDYRQTHLHWRSGVRITDVVVLSPPELRGLSPELLRLGSLEVGWSLGPLLRRQGLLTQVVLRDLAVTVVYDAAGRLPRPPSADSGGKAPKKPTPPSRLLTELLRGAPPFTQAAIEGLTLTVLLPDEPPAQQRLRLTLPRLGVVTARAPGGWQLHAFVGTAAAPQSLAVQRERGGVAAGEAAAELWLSATVSPSQAQASIDLRVLRQTLAPTYPLNHLLALEAQARFDGSAGRIAVTLGRLMVADGAVTLDADLELPDEPGTLPVLRRTRGRVDLEPLRSLISANLIPVSAQRAQLQFDIGSLLLVSPPRLAPGGHATVDGDFDTVAVALAGRELALGRGKLALTAEPTAENGTQLRATVPLHGLHFTRPGESLAGDALEITAVGHIDPAGAITGDATLHLAGLLRTTGDPGPTQTRIAVRGGHLAVHATEVHLEPVAPPAAISPAVGQATIEPHAAAIPPAAGPATAALPRPAGPAAPHHHPPKRAVHARLTVSGQLDGASVVQPTLQAAVDRIDVTAQAQLTGGAPYSLAVDLPLTGLQLADGKGHPWLSGPARLSASVAAVYPDHTQLRHTRGELKLAIEVGTVRAQLDAHKHLDSVDFDLAVDATSLAAVRPLVSAASFQVPWENLALALHSQGKVEQLFDAAPRLSQHSQLRLDRPAFKSATGAAAAQGLVLVANTTGTVRHHVGDLDLQVRGLTVSGQSLADVHLTLTGDLDVDAPALRLKLASDAQTGPQGTIAATLAFDRRKQALRYDLAIKVAKLEPLQPFLARLHAVHGFDLSPLELGLSGQGTVVGLLESGGGALRLTAHPLATLGIDGTLAVRAAGLYWGDGDRVVKSPLVSWHSTLSYANEVRKLHGQLQLEGLHVEFGEHELDFIKASDDLDLTMSGDLALGEGELTQHLSLGELQQDFLSGYALRGVNLQLRAQRNADGELHIAELKLDNAGGGTALDLTGHLDVTAERRNLSLHGTLNQQLDRLWSEPEVYVGRGAVALNVGVSSGNLALFHAQAEVQVTDGNVTLPHRGVVIEGFGGEVPITADVLLDPSGFHLVSGPPANVYSQLRYADQHPLLSGRSFITVGRIATPLFTVAGLAGNLRIEQSLVSLNQFELETRGGQVSGQCLVDFRPTGPTMQLRVRATHLAASHGERFDGNAAVVVGLRDRSVAGRAEILRIGRRHLLDLLELHDPQHTDPAVNRIRTALGIGYPERLSLAFDHGFATARISLGGLAGLFRIDPLRGIPMGPIIDNLLQKGSDTEEEP